MRNKKLLIVTLVILNVLNFRLRKGIGRSMIYKIYLKHGIFLSLNRIRIDRRLNIVVDRIYFRKSSRLKVFIKSFSIRLAFARVIKRISCELIDIVFEPPKKISNKQPVNPATKKEHSAIVKRLFRRIQGSKLSRLAGLVHSVNVDYIRIRYPKENMRAELAVSNLNKAGHILSTDDVSIKHKDVVIAEISTTEISITKNNSDQYLINSKVENFGIDFPLLSTEPLNVEEIEVSAEVNVLKDRIEMSRSSKFLLNNIPFLVEFSYDFLKNDYAKFSFIIIIKGSSFFKSYPFFYTQDLKNIDATGDLVLQVIYVHNLQNPSASYFRTKVIKDDLKIENFNTPAFCNLAADFSHTAIKNGKTLRQIQLCDCNPGFLKIEHIPKSLSDLVVLSEDPKFYEHNGIDVYNVQQAILWNLESGKFSRGASTITMQLVRNIFLGHHKNISRKLEEFIIAWLLEKHASLKKDRILELYLNIIEFGDNVYGISEASQYYFGKPVNELSLTEQLVLSYIIPRPDFFLDALLSQSKQLKERLKHHIHYYGQKFHEQNGTPENGVHKVPGTIAFKPEFGCLCLD